MAIGLASMNPMVGPNANNGVLLFKQVEDKDIKDGWGSYGATRSFDNEDYLRLDQNNKPEIRKVEELEESNVVVYRISSDEADQVMNTLVNEACKPYNEREPCLHNLYEELTSHRQYIDEQVDYDPLLERVYLDRLTKKIDGIASEIESEHNRMVDGSTEGFYPMTHPRSTPDEDDANVKFPLLASAVTVSVEEAEAVFEAILNGKDEINVSDQ